MNQKNSLGIDKCFKDTDDPIKLFEEWFNEAKKTEINDPNALALATADKSGAPSVRMVLLKSFNKNGFIFYTNFGGLDGGTGSSHKLLMITEAALCPSFHAPSTYPLRSERASPASKIRPAIGRCNISASLPSVSNELCE